MNHSLSWTDAFPGFKKTILLFASIVIILVNVTSIVFSPDLTRVGLVSNLIEISVIGINLLLYLLKKVPLNLANGVLVYFLLLINFSMTLFFKDLLAQNLDFSKITLIVLVAIVMMAFLMHKKHIFIGASLYLLYSIAALLLLDYSFYEDGIHLSLIIAFGFMAGIYLLMTHLEKSYQKQNELINEIEERNEELEIQSQQLQRLNSVKTRFISIISHDLSAPLSAVIGLMEFVMEDLQKANVDKASERLDVIRESLDGGQKLMRSLLDWIRSNPTDDVIKLKEHNLKAHVYDSFSSLKVMLVKKEIELIVNIPDELIIWADGQMFNTLVRNLVSNSIKFTPEGGKITISGRPLERAVELVIEDNGIGIAPEVVGRMFTEKRVMSTSGTNNEPGTGLGLVLCKAIVDNHNGSISVESEEGKGSKFIIVLPLVGDFN